jgi:hypothetical protein
MHQLMKYGLLVDYKLEKFYLAIAPALLGMHFLNSIVSYTVVFSTLKRLSVDDTAFVD